MSDDRKEILIVTIVSVLITIFIVGIVLILNYGVTDAGRAKVKALGDSARVTCYSGTKLIFDACSTGKVHSESDSDGYFFEELSSGFPVEVSGNCILVYQTKCPIEPTGLSQ